MGVQQYVAVQTFQSFNLTELKSRIQHCIFAISPADGKEFAQLRIAFLLQLVHGVHSCNRC
jgi:hypothetical protein